MAVGSVFAEADVSDDDKRVEGAVGFQGAQGSLNDSVRVPGAGGLRIFFRRDAEEQYAAETERSEIRARP